MASFNQVQIIGSLGNDPETRYSAAGTAITKISVATSEKWTDKQTGEKQERTEWHKVTFFGKLAEIAGEYLKKGRSVFVQGSLRTDKYTDKEGVERYSTGIVGDKMVMLSGGDGGERQQGGGSQSRSNGGQRQAPAPAPAPAFDDDDIPF